MHPLPTIDYYINVIQRLNTKYVQFKNHTDCKQERIKGNHGRAKHLPSKKLRNDSHDPKMDTRGQQLVTQLALGV